MRTILLFAFILSISHLSAQPFNFKYSATLGTEVLGIAVDSEEFVYAIGRGNVYNSCLTENDFLSDGSVFIAKLDQIGNKIWVRRFGGDKAEIYGIDVDSEDNIIVGGSFWDEGDFRTSTQPDLQFTSKGQDDAFVMKCNGDGEILWVEVSKGTSENVILDLAVGPNDEIYSTGRFLYNSNFGQITLTSFENKKDPFIWALTSEGATLWARNVESYHDGSGEQITVDASGNVLAYGLVSQQTGREHYILKLAADGQEIFYMPTLLDPRGRIVDIRWSRAGLGTDSKDNIYLAGGFVYRRDFNPGVDTFYMEGGGQLNDDAFLLKLDANGAFLWAQQIGYSFSRAGGKVVKVDENDNIFVVGEFSRKTDFDPGPEIFHMEPESSAATHVYVQVLDSSGQFITAIEIGTNDFRDFTTWDFEISGDNYYLTRHEEPGNSVSWVQAYSKCDVLLESEQTFFCDQIELNGEIRYSDCVQSTTELDTMTGCEVITRDFNKIVTTIIPGISTNDSLIFNTEGYSGIWMDCDDNYKPIEGETNSVFKPARTGNYAFIAIDSNLMCLDTTDCIFFEVDPVSTKEVQAFENITINPNPTSNYLDIKNLPLETVEISFMNANGVVLESLEKSRGSSDIRISMEHLHSGIYYLYLKSASFRGQRMLVKY